jgi:hypothetical protein
VRLLKKFEVYQLDLISLKLAQTQFIQGKSLAGLDRLTVVLFELFRLGQFAPKVF